MQTGAATVENSMEFPRKLKMELPFYPVILLLGLYPKNPEAPIQKNLCTPMFIVVLFTIAKCWKQPKCPSVTEWIKKLWYIYTVEYDITERNNKLTIYDSVDGTEEYYGKWNKPGGERQIPYDLTYKRDTMNKNKSTSKTEQETWKHRTAWQGPEGSGEEDTGGKGKGVVQEQV